MGEIGGIAIVRFSETGEISYHVASDERFRLFIVDERCPHDRVYEWRSRDDGPTVAAILGDGPFGHSGDERHAAVAAVIEAHMDGRRHLAAVPAEDTP